MTSILVRRKETLGICTRHKNHGKPEREGSICKPKRETSAGTDPADILILDVQSLELRENKSLLFKPPTL